MHGRIAPAIAALALAGADAALAGPADTPVEWLLEPRAGVVELRLAHFERPRPDGGVLLVDSNRRLFIWEGIPGELGCRQKLEVPFDAVRAVRDEPEGLIRLEIKGQPRGRWVFVPLPHAAWLGRVSSPFTTGLRQDMAEVLTGPDGMPMAVGGSARFAGPQVRQDAVPGEVTADVRLAVQRVRAALGRPPAPSVELYEALNGRPVEVTIAELLEELGLFAGRAVRVRGTAEPLPQGRGLKLVDEGVELRVVPQPELEAVVQAQLREWRGHEVEVAGVVKRATPATGGGPGPEVAFWEFLGPERVQAAGTEAVAVRLADLVGRPAELGGRTVRVVGRFRGRNLEHDLPEPGPRSAWVLKSGPHAIWVTGHKPSGPGFSLKADRAGDTGKWLEVTGRVETWKGVTTLRAREVALTAPAASVTRGRRLLTAEKPDVVFTLPVAGDEPVPPDAVFLVQFSTYMDEESFAERVRLRYGDVPEEQGELTGARWRYDETRRTLVVDPGQPLRPGSTVELLLLPGIEDAWGTPLAGEPGASPDRVLARLRWPVEE